MSAVAARVAVVVVAVVVGVWVLSSTVPLPIGAAPDAVGPAAQTTDGPGAPTAPGAYSGKRPADPRAAGRDRRDRALGVQLSAHHTTSAGRALRVMDELQEAGAGWLRVDVGWSTLQPDGPGAFDGWYRDLLDDVLAGARERGLEVILALWSTPEWASASGALYAPPSDPGDYAAAIGRAAQRWGDEVAAWEVWNEPNFDTFFEGADPAVYTDLLCAAYPAVKAHDDSPVLFGGLMYNDDVWLHEAYDAGAQGCFDALATHPYVGPSDAAPDTPAVGAVWRLTYTPAMREVMDEHGDEEKRIWITELGWSSGPDNEGNSWDRPVSPRRQARFLREAVALVRADYPYVGPIIWYRDVDGPTDDYKDGFGLLHADLTPKPALAAFRAAVRG